MNNNQKYEISRFLNLINIYGIRLSLFYKNRSEYSSNLGIILSFLSYIIIIIYSTILFLRLILHSSFTILSENYYSGQNFINLTEIPFVLGIINLAGDFLPPNDKYKISVSKGYFKSSNDYIVEQIKFENCTNSPFIKQYPNLLRFPISNYLCVEPNQNLSIFGRYGDFLNGFQSINIFVNECTDKNCTFDYDIDINDYLLQIIYLSNIIDHQNYHNPVQEKFRDENVFVDTSHFKKYLYYLTPFVYESNTGYFLDFFKQIFAYQFDHFALDIINKDNNSSKLFVNGNNYTHLLQLAITCSDYPLKVTRTYLKLMDIFPIIGGCIDFMFMIFKFITLYFTKKTFFNDIANFLINKTNFDFYSTVFPSSMYITNPRSKILPNTSLYNKNNNISKNHLIINKTNKKNSNNTLNRDLNYNSSFKMKVESSNNTLDFQRYIRNQKPYRKQKFKVSFLDYILPYFCIQKYRKNNYVIIIYNYIKKYLSIEEILPIIERISRYYREDKSDLKFINSLFDFSKD